MIKGVTRSRCTQASGETRHSPVPRLGLLPLLLLFTTSCGDNLFLPVTSTPGGEPQTPTAPAASVPTPSGTPTLPPAQTPTSPADTPSSSATPAGSSPSPTAELPHTSTPDVVQTATPLTPGPTLTPMITPMITPAITPPPTPTPTLLPSDRDDDQDGYTEAEGDCDDSRPELNPDALELCDGWDNNCDGQTDADASDMLEWYPDADADGFGDALAEPTEACEQPETVPDPSGSPEDPPVAWVANAEDCDDSSALTYPEAPEICDHTDNDCDQLIDDGLPLSVYYLDADQDAYGGIETRIDCRLPEESSSVGGDCNDADPDIHPGASELCDGIDQNCNGQEDDGILETRYYIDRDGDGYGDSSTSVWDCAEPSGYVLVGGDCNDLIDTIYPGAEEQVGDSIDSDCTGTELCYQDADGDTYAAMDGTLVLSRDTDCFDPGEASNSIPDTDCNDLDADIHPAAVEGVGDELDQDCDGTERCLVDVDQDGYSPDLDQEVLSENLSCTDAGEALMSQPSGDCDDADPSRNPGATELTGDGVDQTCDGRERCYVDADNDGFRPDTVSSVISEDSDCQDGGEATATDPAADCNDANAAVYPGAPEIVADQVDQDCNGAEQCYLDGDDDGFRPDASSTTPSADSDCQDRGEAVGSDPMGDCVDTDASINPGKVELAGDEVDQNCDGAETCFVDADGDGFRPNASATLSSADKDCADSGEATAQALQGDCNDQNRSIYPGAPEAVGDGIDQSCDGAEQCYKDSDGDGFRPDAVSEVFSSDPDCLDPGEAGVSALTGDCNDSSASVYPGAVEVTGDGIDQSCDGRETCYKDGDGDGYRPDATSTVSSSDTDCRDASEAPSSAPTGDCNDGNSSIYPGAIDVAGDGIDQNCDFQEICYRDADNDGYRPDSFSTTVSVDSDCSDSGEALGSDPTGDCNDGNAAFNPAATELTGDGVDQNCDGKETCYTDADDDGVRPDASAAVASADPDCSDSGEALSTEPTGDCNDQDSSVRPGATEVVGDSVDQSCDGKELCYTDADNDGSAVSATLISSNSSCADAGEGTTAELSAPTGPDCNDANPSVRPGAVEITGDGVDQSCDGQELCYVDADNDGYRPNSTATVSSTDADCTDSGEALGTDPIGDCNDQNASIHPGVIDLPDDSFIDADCDGIDGDEQRAIFVYWLGQDSNSGSKTAPKKTIGAAVAAAQAANKTQVLVASGGTYAENPVVTGFSSAGIYGGYAWSSWTRSNTLAEVKGTGTTGMSISSSTGLVLDRLSVVAMSSSAAGSSSYGVFCSACPSLRINKCALTAGNGAAGTAGSVGQAGANGNSGGAGGPGDCSDNSYDGNNGGGTSGASSCSAGGKGGDGGDVNGTHSGLAGAKGGSGACGGAGGASSSSTGGDGTGGCAGSAGAAGTNGAGGSAGVASSSGWSGNSGATGGNGTAGGGGGGGGGGGAQVGDVFTDDGPGNGGGGGGGGGCGGTGATGGKAGGGSFGLFLVNSSGVTLIGSTLTAKAGGTGGAGGAGGTGGTAGVGGRGNTSCTSDVGSGGNGGSGGAGGRGGHGGGGAGGPSFAVYQVGSSVVDRTGSALIAGSGGAGGTSSGNPGSAGATGEIN